MPAHRPQDVLYPMLWISVNDAVKLVFEASRCWPMYATYREGWLTFLCMVVDSAVDTGNDVSAGIITGSNLPAGLNLELDEATANLWAQRALALLDKYRTSAQPKPV